jgi:beta-fructofuranosidase
MLYRQTLPGDVTRWTYLGPLVSVAAHSSFSKWSGGFGINFETIGVARLNERGMAYDDGGDLQAVDILLLGTEHGRNGSHENHWPLCECLICLACCPLIKLMDIIIGAAITYETQGDGSVNASLDAVGVIDWGHVYAPFVFPVSGNRSVLVGWAYVSFCLSFVLFNPRVTLDINYLKH